MPERRTENGFTVLHESTGLTGMEVDRDAGVVRNIPLLGCESPSRKRSYSLAAMEEAAALFTGKPFYGDRDTHEDWKRKPSPFDLIGIVEAARFVREKGQIRGDVRPNSRHADWFFDLCESMPSACGSSPRMLGKEERQRGGGTRVTKIADVHRVDLVSRPGTVHGLHESADDGDHTGGGDVELKDLTAEQLLAECPDLVSQIVESRRDADETTRSLQDAEAKVTQLTESLKEAQQKIDAHEAQAAVAAKKAKAQELVGASELPKEAVTGLFLSQLCDCKDEDAMKALIEDRAKLVGSAKATPRSAGRTALHESASGGGDAPKLDELASILTS
jgi:hypothetical protein